MAKIRDYKITTYVADTTPWVPEMPVHEAGDLLVVFACKDGTAVFNASTNPGGTSWTRRQTIGSAGARVLCETLVAARSIETWNCVLATTDTGCILVASIQDVDASTPVVNSWITAADDTSMPFAGYSGATTGVHANCLIFHMLGSDGGLAPQAFAPHVNLFAGDAANGSLCVAYTFQTAAGSIAQPWFLGHADDDTRSITLAVKSSNAGRRQAYSDPAISVGMYHRTLAGAATIQGTTWPASHDHLLWGDNWNYAVKFAGGWTDITTAANDHTTTFLVDAATGNLVYYGSTTKFCSFSARVTTAGTSGVLAWEYWNGSAWVSTGVTGRQYPNLTTIGANLITLSPEAVAAMQTTSINSSPQYYYIRSRVTTNFTVNPTVMQTRKNGYPTVVGAGTSSADNGCNPFANAVSVAAASSTITVGGAPFTTTTPMNMSTGITLGTFRGALARDGAIDGNKPWPYSACGSLQVFFSNNTTLAYKSWCVHAIGALSTNPDDRNVFAIDLSGTNTPWASYATLDASSIARVAFASQGFYGAALFTWSSLVTVNKIAIAGGSSAYPFNFDDLSFVLNNCVGVFPLFRKSGSAAKVYAPLQFGGADRVCVGCSLSTFNFPTKYDGVRYFDWNVENNVAGIKFYPKTGDVLNFVNCVFNGGSPYRFEFDASSATDATLDFSGTVVIGATVTLRAVGTAFQGMSFISCPAFTQNSAELYGCYFDATKILSNNPTLIEESNFSSAGTGHALELTTAGTYTLTSLSFIGYAGSDGSTGNEAIYNNSGGAVTLNIDGGTTPSIRNGTGASTNVVAGSVSVSVTAQKADGTKIPDANVFLAAADGGGLPNADTVTIANSGTTATVTHTAHGLLSTDKVLITGASHAANNGVFTITRIGADSYSYTMGSAPGSNPTGTILSTFVLLKGLTSALGVLSMSRVFGVNQPVYGWVRKSSSSPYYKEGALSGTVLAASGGSFTAILSPDE